MLSECGPGRALDVSRRGALGAVGDVVVDRALEQPCILQHHAEAAPDFLAGRVAGIDAIDEDPTGLHLVEPHEQIHEGGLACSGGADDRDRLPGLDIKAQILDKRHILEVAEANVLEANPAGRIDDSGRRLAVRRLLRNIENLEDPFDGRRARLQQVGHPGDLHDRHRELPRVLDERLHVAKRHRAARNS